MKVQSPAIRSAIQEADTAFRDQNWAEAYALWSSIPLQFKTREFEIGDVALRASVSKRLRDLPQYLREIAEHEANCAAEAKKRSIVVFTAITGNYDSVKMPAVIDPRFDYVLYSDAPVSGGGLWDVRPVMSSHHCPARASRYVKMHPHTLLDTYEIAIWVDANIMILGDIYTLIQRFIDAPEAIAAIQHPHRDTIYQEIEACIALKKDAKTPMREQVSRYRREGFAHDDLVEANVLMFKQRDSRVRSFLTRWWSEMERGSKRDQLAFNYAMQQTACSYHQLLARPYSARNHELFALVEHDQAEGPAQELINAIDAPENIPHKTPPRTKLITTASDAMNAVDSGIDIIIYNQSPLSILRRCLKSVLRAERSRPQRIVVIDDAEDVPLANGLRSIVRSDADVRILRNDRSEGYTRSVNKALAATSAPFALLLSSSAVVTDRWADKLADAILATPGAGLVGPLFRTRMHSDASSGPMGNPEGESRIVREIQTLDARCEREYGCSMLPRAPALSNACLGIRRDVLDELGYLDDATFPTELGCDIDYCFRAADAGHETVVVPTLCLYDGMERRVCSDKETARRLLAGRHCKRRLARAFSSIRKNSLLARLFDKPLAREVALQMPLIFS